VLLESQVSSKTHANLGGDSHHLVEGYPSVMGLTDALSK
jgi:hypothetical protein